MTSSAAYLQDRTDPRFADAFQRACANHAHLKVLQNRGLKDPNFLNADTINQAAMTAGELVELFKRIVRQQNNEISPQKGLKIDELRNQLENLRKELRAKPVGPAVKPEPASA